MHKSSPFLTLCLTGLLTLNPANAKQDKPMTEDQKNVLASVSSMTEAFHNGNLSKVMNAYEKSPAIAFEPGQFISDRKTIEQMFQGAFTLKPEFSYAGHEVMVSGNLAVHIAPWTMQATSADGQSITQSGLSVAVLRRQVDGTWLLVIDNPHGQHLMQAD
ncbi:MAG: DUF4440 domain-containing protein [Rhizobiaceae bacterium]|nr:DUF4440 domain-containing protein [Rhizobiaceae bacterium]